MFKLIKFTTKKNKTKKPQNNKKASRHLSKDVRTETQFKGVRLQLLIVHAVAHVSRIHSDPVLRNLLRKGPKL